MLSVRRALALAPLLACCGPPGDPGPAPPGDPVPAAPPGLRASTLPDTHRDPDLVSPPAPVPSDLSLTPATPPPPTPPPPPTAPLELAFVGDIILGKYRLAGYASLITPDDPPFTAVADLLRADITVANLETPLMHTRPERSPISIGSRFGADKASARALVGSFHALGLANNHALDLLGDGLRQTPEVLRELDLIPVGEARATGDPVQVVTLERHGWRVALLAATTWTNRGFAPGDPALAVHRTGDLPRALLPAITAARRDHDLVIVLLHWGREYTDRPDHGQRRAAARLIAGGADLVVGHHPHVLHGLERIGDGLVAYSLGNFLFANTDERSRRSGVLRLRWSPGQRCPERVSFHPVWLGDAPGYRPAPATGARATQILQRVQAQSQQLRTPLLMDQGALILRDFPCRSPPR